MSPGKMAAQAGHAFLGAMEAARGSADADRYLADSPGTKVVLGVENEELLLLVEHLARTKGIPTFIVVDSGHIWPPDFDGSEIVTALGIGPVTKDDAQVITNRLRLY